MQTIDFHRPAHAPSLGFGFGFGLGTPGPTWQAGPPAAASPFQLASFSQPPAPRVQKRRLEDDEPVASRDQSMDRSPTPERPKRAAPKRMRTAPANDVDGKEETKENKAPNATDDNDVDVGVLLASLPSQSLLPILTSLLSTHPSLKSAILPLIPRPTLDTALQALSASARKLRDAYPYSNSPMPPVVGFGAARTPFGAFGRPQAQAQPQPAMRDSYVVSRLGPHITEFVAACMSYMPYFSLASPRSTHHAPASASETYLFLAALTDHLFAQPQLTQSSLAPLLLPRLSDEWRAWVHKIAVTVNHEGGMFSEESVKSWERGLSDFADNRGPGAGAADAMRAIRDSFLTSIGWVVGFRQQPMIL